MAKVEYSDLANENIDDKVKALQTALKGLEKTVEQLAEAFKPAKKTLDDFVTSTKAAITAQRQGQETIKKNTITISELAKKQMEAASAAAQWKKLILEGAEAAKIAEANDKRLTLAINAENEATKRGAKSIALLTKEKAKNAKEIQKLTDATKKQTAAMKDEIGSYNALQKELKENVVAYKKMSASERDTTAAGKQLTSTIRAQEAQLKKLDATIGRSFRNVGNYASALRGVRGSLIGIAAGAGLATGATLLIGQAMAKGAKIIVNFEKQNAILAGVLGKTTDQMSDLTDEAIRLGGETQKTSSEVTQLQISLARLGFTQSEIIDLTEGLINGSIALNANLDETGALVGAMVRTFGELGTSDTVEIMDKLTIATQKSALSFGKLQTALPIVAGAANAANVPFTTTLALLGKLADAGIDTSMSATSLRNIFIDAAAKGENFSQILDRIKGSSDKLTAANDELGRRTAVSATVLAESIDTIGEFETAIDKAGGTSARVAKIQMATLSGQIDIMQAAWERLVLSIDKGEGAFSIITRALVSASTATANFLFNINELSEFDKVREGAKEFAKDTDNLSKNIFEASLQLDKNITAIANWRKENRDADGQINEFNDDYEKLVFELESSKIVLDTLQEAQKALNETWDEGSDDVQVLTTDIKGLRDEYDKLVQAILKGGEAFSLTGLFTEQGVKAKEEIENFKKQFTEGLLGDDIAIFFDKVAKDMKAGVEQIDAELGATEFTFFEKIQDFFISNKDELLEAITTIATGVADLFSNISDLQNTQIQQELDAIEINKDAQIAAIEATLLSEEEKAAEIAIINKQAAEEQKALNREKAENDKKAALFEAIISTAVAVVQALPNIFLAAAVAVLGAAEIAVIAKTPIPAFSKGTESSPDGPALVGEKGSELVVTPSGKLSLTPSSTTVMDLERGSKVYTAQETKNILDAFGSGARELTEPIVVNSGLTAEQFDRGVNRIESAFENQVQQVFSVNKRGLDEFINHRGNKTAYYNKRYN